jgi:hypothetical protein
VLEALHEGGFALRELVVLPRRSGVVVVVNAVAWPTSQVLALKKVP